MTPAQLFDTLHEHFGIGAFDDVVRTEPPWWQERGRQIAKLKAMMRRRNVSEVQIAIAANYAASHCKPIKYFPQLFELIPEAMRAHRVAEQAARKRAVRDQLSEAISESLRNGEDQWAQRLMRVADVDAERVLMEWRGRAR